MNEGQDNANKAGGGSTAGSQGIFSTPELTVDAEKISQANTNTEQKRVASFFANTDAGQRSQKLNNAMGISSQPITEDLVIQNEPKKKSKLPIILVVVVLIAVVGGLVGWMVLRNRTSSENSSKISSIQEAQRKFDEFATFVLYGEAKNELTGKYDPSEAYAVKKYLNYSSESDTFWTQASTLLSTAVETYDTSDKKVSDLTAFLESYRQDFDLLNILRRIPEFELADLLPSYVENGSEQGAAKILDSYYVQLNEDDYDLSKQYYELSSMRIHAMFRVIDFLNARGCISSDKLDDLCVESSLSETGGDLSDTLSEIESSSVELQGIFDNITIAVISDCWQINALFEKANASYGDQE